MSSVLDTVFGGGAPSAINYNRGVSRNLDWLGKQFQGDNTSLMDALNSFRTANAALIPKMQANATQAGKDFDSLFQSNRNYNPLDTYNTIRSGNLSALKDWSGQLEGAGSRADNLALAAMGMGGRPDSSYGSILRADRVSRNIAPVLGNIFSSLGNDTATIGNQRTQNLGNLADLINARTNAPLTGYGLELDPANALLALRSGQTGLLGQQADVAKTNNAGWYQQPGWMDYANKALQHLSNVASTASQWAGMVGGMGGGAGGGGPLGGIMGGNSMGGGLAGGGMASIANGAYGSGGGGFTPNSAPSMYNPSYQPTSFQPAQPYSPWGNYNVASTYGF